MPKRFKAVRQALTVLRGLAVFLVKRLLGAAAVLVLVGMFTFGLIRWLRPEQYPGPLIAGTRHDLARAFLHFDFGPGCSPNPACFPVRLYWERGWHADDRIGRSARGGVTTARLPVPRRSASRPRGRSRVRSRPCAAR